MHRSSILTAFESCARRGVWSQQWEYHRLTASQMVARAVTEALRSNAPDPGQLAGDTVMTLASERGLDTLDSVNVYRSVVNHAAIADIVTTAIRRPGQPPWDDSTLRRFLPVTAWNDTRKQHEIRSWDGIGEVCRTGLPMQMVVAVLAQTSGGRRHGYWSKALLHPQRSSLRFKKRTRATIEGFKESWIPCWREDHDEITRDKWLQSMMDDGVLQESLFVVNIPVPGELEVRSVNDLAVRQMDRLNGITELPDKQMSTCDGPLHPCEFRHCCWGQTESRPEEGGFDQISL